jgi:hypothetical protein
MRRYVVLTTVLFATFATAQEQPPRAPTPDELAFARLPQEVQAMLAAFPAREALQKYDYARQNLIALGTPDPSPERLRAQLEAVLAPRYSSIQSYSAGATTFPPLSPLVPATSFDYR